MNVLIVHKCLSYPLRGTSEDHVYSFYKYNRNNYVFYLRLDDYLPLIKNKKDKVPAYIKRVNFDVIVFHYGFASARFVGDQFWNQTIKEVEYFKKSSALKVLFVQDEQQNTIQLNNFINYHGINIVYTLAQEENWSKVFNAINRSKVKLITTLTGYIDLKRHKNNNELFGRIKKTIDIGYRARKMPPWLGRHAYRKTEIAEIFKKVLPLSNLIYDISTEIQDTLFGKEWDKFLYRCKYMIGVESGASLHDPDGNLWAKCSHYIKEHKEYTFEEIESLFFPNMDGNLNIFVISPRNFECSASKTCQVLVEGDYNGILKPNVHYIPIAKDFSNIQEVIEKIKKDDLREEIVNRAYDDLVASGSYTYNKFVKDFYQECESYLKQKKMNRSIVNYFLSHYSYYQDRISWKLESIFFFKKKYFNKWYFIEMLVGIKRKNKLMKLFYGIFIKPLSKLKELNFSY